MPDTASAPVVDVDLVQGSLQAILASKEFTGSARLQAFLTFIVEETLAGHQEQIKETVIAERVFHRRASFDPRLDSVVRVAAPPVACGRQAGQQVRETGAARSFRAAVCHRRGRLIRKRSPL